MAYTRGRMKTIGFLKHAFALIGFAMLVGAVFWYQNTRAFVGAAVSAQGTVVDLVAVRSSDGTTYRPVVRFQDGDGRTVEFSSSTSSNPPRYSRGEQLTVLYKPGDPHEAEIDGWFSLWGGPTIVAGLGSLFFLVGGGIIFAERARLRREEALRASGLRIDTDFQSVELNTSLRVNGRHPFRVLTQWQNPSTSEIHVFRSSNLWFDPEKYLPADKRIPVYIEPGNPRRYFVDLSFLPKLAA
jgi:hypothetical protein